MASVSTTPASSSVRIVPVEPSMTDVEAMADLARAAFGPDPLMDFCFHQGAASDPASQQAQREMRMARTQQRLADPQWMFRKAVDPADPEGRMLGLAQWHWSVDPEHDPLGPFPPGAHLECLDATLGKLRRWRTAHFSQTKQPFLYMYVLVVRPDAQRRGVGSALLRDGLALADRHQQPSFIEATPSGLPLYRKFGWEEKITVTVNLKDYGGDDTQYTMVGLVRPPGPEDKTAPSA